jgi:hypothetical protein
MKATRPVLHKLLEIDGIEVREGLTMDSDSMGFRTTA